MKVTSAKNCFCHTCGRAFHYLGIARHIAAHRARKETCAVTFTDGTVYVYRFSTKHEQEDGK